MTKYAAFGSVFKRGATTIAAIRDIQGPTLASDTIDVTTHDSPGAWREFVAGLIDGGEISLDLIWDPDNATQTSLRTDLVARAAVTYSITFPDATPAVATFSGFVTAFEIGAPADGELSASVTIKTTGAVVFT